MADGQTIYGEQAPPTVVFTENGLEFEADVVHGHKTGHFLDQRDNRQLVRGLADGARVLDVLTCTGGFSLHAAAGGASEVVSIDQSAPAQATARRNFSRNAGIDGVSACRHDVIAGDAFGAMTSLISDGQRFDLVVVGPPSFALRQAGVARALKTYQWLSARAVDLVNDGDWLVQSSCSSRVTTDAFVEVVHGEALSRRCVLADTLVTAPAEDHPTSFRNGAYLKTLLGRVPAAH